MKHTEFRPCIKDKTPPIYGNQIAKFGVPGIPFPEPVLPSPIFCQGEDVVYDGQIYVDEEPIDLSRWQVSVILKKSEYALCIIWKGVLNNGLYVDNAGMFHIWIPSSLTSNLLAGTYWFDVLIEENAGANKGPKPRTEVVMTSNFSIVYSMSSPHPDSDSQYQGKAIRNNVERTAPNLYNPVRPSL